MGNQDNLSNVQLFKEFLYDPERKNLPRIFYEFFYLFAYYRELPVHYFSRFLFKKGINNIKDYLPNKFLGRKIPPHFNEKMVKDVLDNKLYFDFFYNQFNIKLPRILLYNNKNMFVFGKKCILVNSFDEFRILLNEVFEGNPSFDSIFIKKTIAGSCGSDIYKLFLHQVKSGKEDVKEIYSCVIKSEFLFQETIKQHEELNKLNDSCINTIRLDTFLNDGTAEIISGYIRMSTHGKCIDNISKGGCQVGIDLKTGKLKKPGYGPIKTCGVKVLTKHPVTNIVFEDFTIPYFTEAIDMVLKAATYMPGLRLVGWDVAIGETGPILVEGNSDYDITGNDLVDGGYLANTTFRKVLHEINYL